MLGTKRLLAIAFLALISIAAAAPSYVAEAWAQLAKDEWYNKNTEKQDPPKCDAPTVDPPKVDPPKEDSPKRDPTPTGSGRPGLQETTF